MKFKRLLYFSIFLLFAFYFLKCEGIEGMPQCEIVKFVSAENDLTKRDSVQIIATKVYEANFIKKIFQGEGYRDAWVTPVTVPIVNFDTLFGGLTPTDKGGGNQTQSLEFVDSVGNTYTLRSINKDPNGLIPPVAKTLRIEGIVTDGISAQHPYGSLIIPSMMEAVGLWHTNPQLIYVPDQKSLDSFNLAFNERIYLLEYETKGTGQWTNLEEVVKIGSTKDVQKMQLKDPNFKIDIPILVRARLFDLLIGDWDRHAKNWGWIFTKKDNQTVATPMACDRDNAFYGIGGLIPSIINRPFFKSILRPFDKKIDHFPGMIKSFDSYFLYETPASIFLKEAVYLQKHLTDEVIDKAIKKWPVELQKLDGDAIAEKIKARRDDLLIYAKEFPVILQKRGPLKEPLKGSTKLWNKMNKE